MLRLFVYPLLFFCVCSFGADNSCYPNPVSSYPQYVIGYGSFMSEQSRQATVKNTGVGLPINLLGYKRIWVILAPGVSTMYLGVLPENDNVINAVLFPLQQPEDILLLDERESAYCRKPVSRDVIQLLTNNNLPQSQFWIYVPKHPIANNPEINARISLAYVDVFLSGCLALEQDYSLTGFADRCIETTLGWQNKWVKDRAYKKRYYIQPKEEEAVNQLLKKLMPNRYNNLNIEQIPTQNGQ